MKEGSWMYRSSDFSGMMVSHRFRGKLRFFFFLPFRQPLPFEAFFAPSSDEEFTVTPSSGELSPAGTEGTLIRVAYKPQIYGKTHKAKLVVQTSDMQWTYDVLGTTADYNPPNARAKILSTSTSSSRRAVKQKKNYVLENLKLQSTAVSSPLKGVRLVTRSAR